MAAGTEEQKRHYIPKLITGEFMFCQGFTEPSGGADLASLRCAVSADLGFASLDPSTGELTYEAFNVTGTVLPSKVRSPLTLFSFLPSNSRTLFITYSSTGS